MMESALILFVVACAAVGGLGLLFLLSVAWLTGTRRQGDLNPNTPADVEWAVLRTYSTPEAAHLDRAMLQGCGVPVRLANEHTVGTDWLYGVAVGVDLRVPGDQLESAELLLRDAYDGRSSVDLEVAEWPSVDTGLRCDRCGSTEVYRVRPSAGWSIASVVLFGLPLLRRSRHQCDMCGNRDTFSPINPHQ